MSFELDIHRSPLRQLRNPQDKGFRGLRSRPFAQRAALAGLVLLAAVALQWLFDPFLSPTIYILLYPAVALVALLVGGAIGIATAGVAAVLGYTVLAPADLAAPISWLRPLIFFVGTAALSIVTDKLVGSQARARQLSEQVRLFFESNVVGIVSWTLEGPITEANAAFLQMTGYTEEDLRAGRIDWRVMTPPEWADADRRAVEELVRTGTHQAYEKEYVRKDGTRVPIVLGAACYAGSRTAGLSFILDISEQKRAQRQLEETRDELRRRVEALDRSNADLAQFAYVASHDLKEPLRAVRAHLKLVDRIVGPVLPEKARPHFDAVLEASQRMASLIDDLLEYARAGADTARAVDVDVESIVRDIVRSLDTTIEERKARIQIEPLPRACLVPAQARQLFQNLITNALKFNGDRPPEILVSSPGREGALVVYSVRDRGIGIAPEHAERVFDIFQQLHDRTSFGGTGLGLSVCKKIVERYDGRIWVDSRPGEGADFRFTVPAAESGTVRPSAPKEAP
jgi:PAS domain S-box-containing protein